MSFTVPGSRFAVRVQVRFPVRGSGFGVRSSGISRRGFLRSGAMTLGGALLLPTAANAAQAGVRIVATDLGGATLLQGAGGNVVAVPGPDGALMIDGGLKANADALLAAVKSATRTD